MSYAFDSKLGAQLYRLLPEVYRTRDRTAAQSGTASEDLAKYLDTQGHLLDLIHTTLQQQLNDTLPESSQDWLLPYFAQLLAVNIVSPDSDGKHAEVANAVSWRQRKGTLKNAEEIVEAVGQMEVEIQEGWKRVAMTARIDMPLLPVKVWDDTLDLDMTIPAQATRHPALPAAMVDLRRPVRAVEALPTNPAARLSNFGGIQQTWRQQHYHGVPCFPGSFDDVSRRTVDLRSASVHHGFYHQKRLLAFTPPPAGLIPFDPIILTWDQRLDPLYEHLFEERVINGVTQICNTTTRIIAISDDVKLDANPYHIEGIRFQGELAAPAGAILELLHVEAARVELLTFSTDDPVLTARDCLFGELSSQGLVQLDSTTVLGTAFLTSLIAIDCLFDTFVGTDISGQIEYSRIPAGAPFSADAMTIEDCTSEQGIFFAGQTVLGARAVLTPNTPPAIVSGASNGGEMGYFHRGREGRPVRISGDFDSSTTPLNLPVNSAYTLADIIFEGTVVVATGHLRLLRAVAADLTLDAPLTLDDDNAAIPVLDARDSLFDDLSVINSLVRLEYCTVMQNLNCKQLQASDCMFLRTISDGSGAEPESGCLRFSRIPVGFDGSTLNVRAGFSDTNTRAAPIFSAYEFCPQPPPPPPDPYEYRSARFGEAGYGVLDLASADAIRFGAEDGGEMGAGHHKLYSLRAAAALAKMSEFLPVGIEPVFIQDRRLLRVPPQIKNSSEGGTP